MTSKFEDLGKTEFFTLETDLGKANFMKHRDNKALCINSENSTYQKGVEYAILSDQIIIPDCHENI